MKNICLIILFSWFLFSCEDIIEVDLRGSEPAIVIEGIINNDAGPYQVRVSMSTNFYDPGIYPAVTNAFVQINDDQGNSEILIERSPGVYIAETIVGYEERNYTLSVTTDGKDFHADSFMPKAVPIDSMGIEIFPGGHFIEEGYIIHCFFSDPPETGNNYRLIAYHNGDSDGYFYLVDDKFTNGNSMDLMILCPGKVPGDTVLVELHSIDKQVYDYYYTLSEILTEQGGGNPANPANPITNLSNGSLGYFGALAISRSTIVIQ